MTQFSDSNHSGPSFRVRVHIQTEPLPNWWSESSIHQNLQLGYGSMVAPNLAKLCGLTVGRLAGRPIDSYKALVFAVC